MIEVSTNRRPELCARQRTEYVPPAEIIEEESGWKIRVFMPGVKSDDLEITLIGNELQVRGKSYLRVPENTRVVYQEYEPGDYARVFNISDHVKKSDIAAELTDGVLTLTLPKAEAAKPLRVPVQVKT